MFGWDFSSVEIRLLGSGKGRIIRRCSFSLGVGDSMLDSRDVIADNIVASAARCYFEYDLSNHVRAKVCTKVILYLIGISDWRRIDDKEIRAVRLSRAMEK